MERILSVILNLFTVETPRPCAWCAHCGKQIFASEAKKVNIPHCSATGVFRFYLELCSVCYDLNPIFWSIGMREDGSICYFWEDEVRGELYHNFTDYRKILEV